MTEIPEHLLRRSRERRSALGGGGDAGAGGDGGGGETPGAAAGAAAAAVAPVEPAPSAVATPVPAAAPPPPPPPKPYVQAALSRRRIPFWAMPVLALLPLWAFLYAESLRDPEIELSGPLAEGEEVYTRACSGCHGASGGGGAGRPLAGGAVIATFPGADYFDDQIEFVTLGSAPWAGRIYGDPAVGHTGGSYNGALMPAQGQEGGGSLTEEEVLAAVCYERVILSGEDPIPPQCTEEGAAAAEGGEGGEGTNPGGGDEPGEAEGAPDGGEGGPSATTIPDRGAPTEDTVAGPGERAELQQGEGEGRTGGATTGSDGE